ncbi:MAG: twin-arginine translocation signal domain-containing protein, partial [Deltaproteobacteria bacterium]|nr:twin-arginine translocation signal domain-containing protein [Deltaproteobacteria bacterium]
MKWQKVSRRTFLKSVGAVTAGA